MVNKYLIIYLKVINVNHKMMKTKDDLSKCGKSEILKQLLPWILGSIKSAISLALEKVATYKEEIALQLWLALPYS